MRSGFLIRTVGKAFAAGALMTGVMTGLAVQAAHAGTAVQEYVAEAADGGVDAGNCTLASQPCATIDYALTQESGSGVGSVINVAKGTYNQGVTLAAGNNDVTITGASAKKTIIEPTSCSDLSATADGNAIVAFGPTIDGVTVENLTLDGAGVTSCTGYSAAVIDYGPNDGNAVVGDNIESGTTFGILTDAGANSTIISNVLTPVLCTSKVTGPNTGLNAGWTSPANLKISKAPKCSGLIESGHGAATGIFVNGVAYCTSFSATGKTLVITGTPTATTGCSTGGTPITASAGLEIAKGATVIFNTSATPFTQWGIACGNPIGTADTATDCAISDNTVTGGGTVYTDFPGCGGYPPVGILATNEATADVDSNSVSDVSTDISECPEAGESTQNGIGIGILPAATGSHDSAGNSVIGVDDAPNPTTGDGNKLGSSSANDVGITVAGSMNVASYQVNGNTVTAANKSGIVLEDLNPAGGSLDQDVENNSVTGVLTGAAYALFGVDCANGNFGLPAVACATFTNGMGAFGGPLKSEGNSATGDGLGLVIGCDPQTVESEAGLACQATDPYDVPSDFNLIQNNTLNNNELYGEMTVGSYQPEEIAAQITAANAADISINNTFDGNTWTGNGAGAPLVDGANVMDGTGWGGGCVSETGDCPSTGVGPLLYEGANTTFDSSTPGSATFTLTVCNAGTSSEDLPVGTEITMYPGNVSDSGTFFVTKDAVITGGGSAANCNSGLQPTYTLSLQALNPEEVGTDTSPSGQPWILGSGQELYVNSNGPAVAAPGSSETYGNGASLNSCSPAGLTADLVTTPNVFGATSTGTYKYSTTLDASTGGVNATYVAC